MDMKSYILIGGGLLICLVLLHALVAAWRANRRGSRADGVGDARDALDVEAEDGAELLWNGKAEAERVGEPLAEEFVAGEEPGPPVLMEPTAAGNEASAGAGIATQSPPPEATEPNPDETLFAETMDTPPATDDGPGVLRRGRRIEIAGKRTEPTVPRAMRPEFTPPEEPRHEPNVPDDVIVVWLFARPGRLLDGGTLLNAFVAHGLKCDADRVFKKTDPRCGGPWYAVANGVEPGTFDISRPAAQEIPGVVMLLNLAEVRDPGPAFEDLLDVAQDLAITLDAELKDEDMSDMSAQTIEHCRQRIRDHRRMLLKA